MIQMPAPSFKPQIHVRAGRVTRELAIEVETADIPNPDYECERPEDPPILIRALAALVAAGGWAMPGETPAARIIDIPASVAGRYACVLHLSASTPDVVGTLARIFEFLDGYGTKRVVALSIAEGIAAGEAVATTAELEARHPVIPAFQVVDALRGDHEAKMLQIHLELERPDDDPALDALRALFDAWGDVLRLGGFPGFGHFPMAQGFVESVEPGLAHEVIVEMEHLFGTDAAWDPIYRGLARIHAICPIREVRF